MILRTADYGYISCQCFDNRGYIHERRLSCPCRELRVKFVRIYEPRLPPSFLYSKRHRTAATKTGIRTHHVVLSVSFRNPG
jgi:hypothetical protein